MVNKSGLVIGTNIYTCQYLTPISHQYTNPMGNLQFIQVKVVFFFCKFLRQVDQQRSSTRGLCQIWLEIKLKKKNFVSNRADYIQGIQYNLWSKHVEFNFLFLEIRKLNALFPPQKIPLFIYLFIYFRLSCGENSLQNNPNTRVGLRVQGLGLIFTFVSMVEHTNLVFLLGPRLIFDWYV